MKVKSVPVYKAHLKPPSIFFRALAFSLSYHRPQYFSTLNFSVFVLTSSFGYEFALALCPFPSALPTYMQLFSPKFSLSPLHSSFFHKVPGGGSNIPVHTSVSKIQKRTSIGPIAKSIVLSWLMVAYSLSHLVTCSIPKTSSPHILVCVARVICKWVLGWVYVLSTVS